MPPHSSKWSLGLVPPVYGLVLATTVGIALGGCDVEAPDEPITSLANDLRQPAPVDDGNDLRAYVAQCEAVLGEIPEISCDPANPAPGTTVTKIPVFVDGMLLGFDEDLSEAEQALLAERAESEEYTCDFPSIGGDFACSVGSTLVHYQDPESPNVQWVALCRGVPWDNPGYDRFIGNGLIGANTQTGEMCFFFGKNQEPEEAYALPALASEASAEAGPWLPPREMPGSCISCHPNNDPWILTPWLMPSYMGGVLQQPEYGLDLPSDVALEDVMAARFIETTPALLQTMLPVPLPEGRTSWTEEEIVDDEGRTINRQYRIVGSSYVSAESEGSVQARTGMRPDSWSTPFRERIRVKPQSESCSAGCHTMGNEYWTKLASDALGSPLFEEHRSEHLSGTMMGARWMDPGQSYGLEQVDPAAFTVPAITECPIPKQVDDVPEVKVSCHEVEGHEGAIRVEWDYDNDYGQVPGRDDVRFDVAFGRTEDVGPGLGVSATSEQEGAPIEEGSGVGVLRDVAPTEGSYQVTLPLDGQERISIALQPKRYCFEEPERRPFAYAVPQRIDIDVAAACG